MPSVVPVSPRSTSPLATASLTWALPKSSGTISVMSNP